MVVSLQKTRWRADGIYREPRFSCRMPLTLGYANKSCCIEPAVQQRIHIAINLLVKLDPKCQHQGLCAAR